MHKYLNNFKQANCSVDSNSSLKVILMWIIGVFCDSNTKTKLEREKRKDKGICLSKSRNTRFN